MSLLGKVFTGWQLRTTKPRLEPGQEVTLVVTDYDHEADAAVARVGDTRIRIEDTSSDIVDMRVRVEITDFDDNDHVGTAELREIVGETMY
jgi:hypothetical protein